MWTIIGCHMKACTNLRSSVMRSYNILLKLAALCWEIVVVFDFLKEQSDILSGGKVKIMSTCHICDYFVVVKATLYKEQLLFQPCGWYVWRGAFDQRLLSNSCGEKQEPSDDLLQKIPCTSRITAQIYFLTFEQPWVHYFVQNFFLLVIWLQHQGSFPYNEQLKLPNTEKWAFDYWL